MDPANDFYQQLDSEALLKQHGHELLAEARQLLAQDQEARVAGMIATPDSIDAKALRDALGAGTGQVVPAALMVGIVPRQAVVPLLEQYAGAVAWREEPWQAQQVFPVVVSTRDGYRFGFFGLG
jgi:hypothetical protein